MAEEKKRKAVWAYIDSLALDNGFSISGLARKAGLDPTTFNVGKRRGLPTLTTVFAICDALNISFSDFARGVENEAK